MVGGVVKLERGHLSLGWEIPGHSSLCMEHWVLKCVWFVTYLSLTHPTHPSPHPTPSPPPCPNAHLSDSGFQKGQSSQATNVHVPQ